MDLTENSQFSHRFSNVLSCLLSYSLGQDLSADLDSLTSLDCTPSIFIDSRHPSSGPLACTVNVSIAEPGLQPPTYNKLQKELGERS